MIDQVHDYLFMKDTESRFVVVNNAIAADFGLKPEDLIGKTDFDLHPRVLAEKFYADEQQIVRSGEPLLDIEEFVLDLAGEEKWLSTSKVPLRNQSGEIIGIVGISRNATERKRAQEEIYFMAHHDPLTGLPNRTMLLDRLSQALRQAERSSRQVTTIFIDLDNFKSVNDRLGHRAGDALLKILAERMIKCVRATDTVVRLGGDEFVIVLVDQEGGSDSSSTLNRLRAALAEPVAIEGQWVRVTCSSGLATFPSDGMDAETLLMNADTAMYRAKENGRDNVQVYTPEMTATGRDRRIG
jgi:diguanylate cyclase (GGDEF)-like protein/PAS domain S-box-containing protein